MPACGEEDKRSSKEVIDTALRENRRAEALCFVGSAGMVLSGVLAMVLSVIKENSVGIYAGGALTTLLFPALAITISIRSNNLRIRLLEVPLAKAKSAKEAADIIARVLNQPKKWGYQE